MDNMIKHTQKIIGYTLLVCLVTILALALIEIIPSLIANAGIYELASVGWVG
jgi:hypothetical protein